MFIYDIFKFERANIQHICNKQFPSHIYISTKIITNKDYIYIV